MKLELPYSSAEILGIRVYHPRGVDNIEQISEILTLIVPDDTYLVIVDAMNARRQRLYSWGFDRIQWLSYKPEYHNPERFAPKPEPEPEPEPEIKVNVNTSSTGKKTAKEVVTALRRELRRGASIINKETQETAEGTRE